MSQYGVFQGGFSILRRLKNTMTQVGGIWGRMDHRDVCTWQNVIDWKCIVIRRVALVPNSLVTCQLGRWVGNEQLNTLAMKTGLVLSLFWLSSKIFVRSCSYVVRFLFNQLSSFSKYFKPPENLPFVETLSPYTEKWLGHSRAPYIKTEATRNEPKRRVCKTPEWQQPVHLTNGRVV